MSTDFETAVPTLWRAICSCGWKGPDRPGSLDTIEDHLEHLGETGEIPADHEGDYESVSVEIDPVARGVTAELLAGDIEEEVLSDHDVDVLAASILHRLPDVDLDEWEEFGLAEIYVDDDGDRAMLLNRNGLRVFRRLLALWPRRA